MPYARPIDELLDVFRRVLRNRDLRRVELAYVGFNATEFAVWIALLVYAYDRGGASEASAVAVAQLAPAALLAPLAAVLADRYRPVHVLTAGYLAQAAGMGATTVSLVAGAPAAVTVLCAAVAATAVTITRPTQAALLPFLARSPDELTASNVVSGWVESGSTLIGTLAAGALLGLAGVAAVFAVSTVFAVVCAVLVAGVHGPDPAPSTAFGLGGELLVGVRALAGARGPRVLVGMLVLELTILGALDILFVVLALDVLDLGRGWAGYLNAAFAVGGAIGSVVAALFVGRRGIAPAIGAGLLCWGVSFVGIASWPSATAAVLLLVGGGMGRAVFDLGCRTLLQRTTPADVLGRVFGLLEGLEMAGLAVGALIVPPLVAAGGSTAALAGVGVLVAASALLALRPLLTVDRTATIPVVEIALLRSMPLFRLLPAPALEGVARALRPLDVPAGAVVIRVGEPGDLYYAIADGTAEVSRDGAVIRTLTRGDGFGEVALLEDVPRTATVRASTALRLYALDKEAFVTAVTGHAPSAHAASELVAATRRDREAVAVS